MQHSDPEPNAWKVFQVNILSTRHSAKGVLIFFCVTLKPTNVRLSRQTVNDCVSYTKMHGTALKDTWLLRCTYHIPTHWSTRQHSPALWHFLSHFSYLHITIQHTVTRREDNIAKLSWTFLHTTLLQMHKHSRVPHTMTITKKLLIPWNAGLLSTKYIATHLNDPNKRYSIPLVTVDVDIIAPNV